MSGHGNGYHNSSGSSSGSAYYPSNGSSGNSGYRSRNNVLLLEDVSLLKMDFMIIPLNTNAKSYGTSPNNFSAGTQGMSLFTHEQYNQIIKMLSKGKGKEVDSMANVATASSSGTLTALMSYMAHTNWIIDTSSSNHTVAISHVGDSLILKDKLVNDDLFSRRVLGIGKDNQGLYLLNEEIQPSTLQDRITRNSCISSCISSPISFKFILPSVRGVVSSKTNDSARDLGELKYFLGIEFSRNVDEFNHKLTSIVFDKCTRMNAEDKVLDDYGKYQRLIGRLLYLIMTRPDIAFVVQVLSQCMHSPKTSHMEAVVRYIKGTTGLGLFIPSNNMSELVAYCDSD
uniref:Reverse transcriptase Ty1/copia-type domain-containing protein n=1 Tax=Solanum lycopersicum TaxID=4081 RepID=A0A3Q7FLL2_SOLLC